MKTTLPSFLLGAAMAMTATASFAVPQEYVLDASHSQVSFSYSHLGFSNTRAMFSGFEGVIMFDQEDPANSSVSVSMPVKSLFTGWAPRYEHFMSGDFFDAKDDDLVTFISTGIEITGEKTANITGDLTVNGITKPVVLDAVLNATTDNYPIAPYQGRAAAGFDATTTLKRSDFDLGQFVPYVGDEMVVSISIEAMKAE